jgi:hypothetical protein
MIVAKRISRIIRRARTSARDKGLPVDKLMPAAVLLIGALLGLVASLLAWQVAKRWFVSHTVSTVLPVRLDVADLSEAGKAAAIAREDEAAGRVTEYVELQKFQNRWREEADRLNLRGARRLSGKVVSVKLRDGQDQKRLGYGVRLDCEGRPGHSAFKALHEARNMIDSMAEPLKLEPVRYNEKKVSLLKKIKAAEDVKKECAAQKAKLAPGPEEERERNALTAKRGAASRELAKENAALETVAKNEKSLREKSKALRKEQDGLEVDAVGTGRADPAELREEQRELEDRIRTSRADCTDKHPVVRRLKAIRGQLRRIEIPAELTKLDRQLKRIDGQRERAQAARNEMDRLDEALDAFRRKYRPMQDKRDAITTRDIQAGNEIRTAREDLKKLDELPHLKILIGVEGRIEEIAPGWLHRVSFCLVGILGCALLAMVFYWRVMPALTVIDDEVDLADQLRVPVLGNVPRLAMLERH